MRALFLGPAAECRGFTLAGVDTLACDTAAAAESALAAARDIESQIGLVLVSPGLGVGIIPAAGGQPIPAPPAVLVMPDPATRAPS